MRHQLPAHSPLTHVCGEPRRCYAAWRDGLDVDEALLLVDFQLSPYWLAGAQPVQLTAIYLWQDEQLRVAVCDLALEADCRPPAAQYRHWLELHGLASFDPDRPLELLPLTIEKPWGREIWYSGVERRGVCCFGSAAASCPIPWLQAALPDDRAGAPEEGLVLLKILDPVAEPVRGDLYFELHERKREVYVVTHIDRAAWPEGVGYVRFGFEPGEIARYPDEQQFRQDYLEAVQAYEAQRRLIDRSAEAGRQPSPGQLEKERRLRKRMNRFTRLQPLREGDVVAIPPLLPHALQHGVRVVEFQTPDYDRKILSFAQKVLTQAHWDTAEAVQIMTLEPPAQASVTGVSDDARVSIEEIADFPDFTVQRVSLAAGASWMLGRQGAYCLAVVVAGVLMVSGDRFEPGRALLLPRGWEGVASAPEAAGRLVFLLARPRS